MTYRELKKQIEEKERVRCMKLIDELLETWREGLKRSAISGCFFSLKSGDYNDGAWTQQTGCLEELETLRAQIESTSNE